MFQKIGSELISIFLYIVTSISIIIIITYLIKRYFTHSHPNNDIGKFSKEIFEVLYDLTEYFSKFTGSILIFLIAIASLKLQDDSNKISIEQNLLTKISMITEEKEDLISELENIKIECNTITEEKEKILKDKNSLKIELEDIINEMAENELENELDDIKDKMDIIYTQDNDLNNDQSILVEKQEEIINSEKDTIKEDKKYLNDITTEDF